MNNKNIHMKEDKKSKKKWVLLLLALLLIAGSVLFVGYQSGWFTKQKAPLVVGDLFPGENANAGVGQLPGLTQEQIKDQMQKQADSTKFAFKINAEPVFENGNSKGTLRIENPNHNIYPFVVKIYLDATGEQIYDSGGILPNHYISEAKLSTVLTKGSHEATAVLSVFDPDTQELLGKSEVKLTIIVKN